ncbi:MAG: ABC transporter ATP-binding protein [Pseudomonadota bacterium]
MLSLENISGGYAERPVLNNISLRIRPGQVISILGANGAGKTSTLRAISGALPIAKGIIRFEDTDISHLPPDRRARLGIAHVPEGRRIFGTLSVKENLLLGSTRLKRADPQVEEEIFHLFPRLKERYHQRGGTLSGGEQQMLAIGRALMSKPKLLILDEPSMGLAPKIVDEVFQALLHLKTQGLTLLLVEQYAKRALALSTEAYVLNQGEVILHDTAENLLNNDDHLHKCYLT